MDTNSLRSRYGGLKGKIYSHNRRYHVLDAPIISNLESDKLLNGIIRIEDEHLDWMVPDSRT